jgi:predicted small lipoprotein YifL
MKKKRAAEILGATPWGRPMALFAALMAIGLLVVGCGQKGPLTLPLAAPAKVKATLPAPAPASVADNTSSAPR